MEDKDACKYCLSDTNSFDNPLILPCKCKQYVHKNCIEKWRKKKMNSIQYQKCEICLEDYKISIFSNKILANFIRFIYFYLSKINLFYFVFNITTTFLIGYYYHFNKSVTIYNILFKFPIYQSSILIKNIFLNGYIFTNNLYLLITISFGIFAYINKKSNIFWKDSEGVDFRSLYLYCLTNVIFLCIESILAVFAIFTQKITLNFLIEYSLRNMKELISENNEHNNYLNVMCCPEIVNNNESRDQIAYYHMINSF